MNFLLAHIILAGVEIVVAVNFHAKSADKEIYACPHVTEARSLKGAVSSTGINYEFFGGTWTYFATFCENEGTECNGVQRSQFNSTCATVMGQQVALVRPVVFKEAQATLEGFTKKFLVAPVGCTCNVVVKSNGIIKPPKEESVEHGKM